MRLQVEVREVSKKLDVMMEATVNSHHMGHNRMSVNKLGIMRHLKACNPGIMILFEKMPFEVMMSNLETFITKYHDADPNGRFIMIERLKFIHDPINVSRLDLCLLLRAVIDHADSEKDYETACLSIIHSLSLVSPTKYERSSLVKRVDMMNTINRKQP